MGLMVLPYEAYLTRYARKLRQSMTDAELRIWSRVRRKQLDGVRFHRQMPIDHFIADFYCPSAKLVIELDGGQHSGSGQHVKDLKRELRFSELGLKVVRFSDRDVLLNMEGVLSEILKEVRARRDPHPKK